jgi:hypothetical protein
MRAIMAALIKVRKPDGSLLVREFSRLPPKKKYAHLFSGTIFKMKLKHHINYQ